MERISKEMANVAFVSMGNVIRSSLRQAMGDKSDSLKIVALVSGAIDIGYDWLIVFRVIGRARACAKPRK